MPKTNSINREDGTDYWMDEKDVKKEQAKKVKRKAPAPDQFPKERIRDEIVSPYKNNWILFIAITIFSIAFFTYLFPEELQVSSCFAERERERGWVTGHSLPAAQANAKCPSCRGLAPTDYRSAYLSTTTHIHTYAFLQIPSIRIPDFETGPAIPESLN